MGPLFLTTACSFGSGAGTADPSPYTPGMGGSAAGGAAGAGASAGLSAGSSPLDLGSIPVGTEGGTSASDAPLPSEVNVIITADNAYGFGYGTATALRNYFGGVENVQSSDIFDCPVGNGPEAYVVPASDANAGGYLYIVGYADKAFTQGVIAKFYREGAPPLFTGGGAWEGCATGEDYDPGSGGPGLDVINAFITRCNAGDLDPLTTSGGWVATASAASGQATSGSVAFGEDNSTLREPSTAITPGNEFTTVCDIDPEAKWMWLDWEAKRTTGSPFIWPGGRTNATKDFVIFRLGAEQIPRKPPK